MTEIDWTLALRADGSPGAILAYADWLEENGAEQGVIDAVRQLPDFVEYLWRAIDWTEEAKGWSVRRIAFLDDHTARLWGSDTAEDGVESSLLPSGRETMTLHFNMTPHMSKASPLLRDEDGPALAWFRATTGFAFYCHHRMPDGQLWPRFVRDLDWAEP